MVPSVMEHYIDASERVMVVLGELFGEECVEKSGLDEVFVDCTDLAKAYQQQRTSVSLPSTPARDDGVHNHDCFAFTGAA